MKPRRSESLRATGTRGPDSPVLGRYGALDELIPSRDPSRRTRILGIVNLTPDSFHDGGGDGSVQDSINRARQLVEDGADALDLGAESSRPGATSISPEEEWRRLEPVLDACLEWDIPISIDTVKSDVARRATRRGATIVNDISAMTDDPDMAAVCAEAGCGVILMHRRGNASTMRQLTQYEDVVRETIDTLQEHVEASIAAGVHADQIVVDPGIGFAKTPEQSFEVVRRVVEYGSLGLPVLVGASRKSFLSRTSGESTKNRLEGTLAIASFCVQAGVEALRVHDVKEHLRAVRTMETLLARGTTNPDQLGEHPC